MDKFRNGEFVSDDDCEYREHDFIDRYNFDDKQKENIKKIVSKWLKEETYSILTLYSEDRNYSIQFSRCIINVKNCANCYDQFLIAVSSVYPELISINVKGFGFNNHEGMVAKNEVLSENHNTDEIYIPLGYKKVDAKQLKRINKLKRILK